MDRYEGLGILSVRWLGLAFLTCGFASLLVGVAGPWTTGRMMGGSMGSMGSMGELSPTMPDGGVHMMQGGVGVWWAPTLLFVLVGALLLLASRPLGRMLGSGLGDHE